MLFNLLDETLARCDDVLLTDNSNVSTLAKVQKTSKFRIDALARTFFKHLSPFRFLNLAQAPLRKQFYDVTIGI